MTSPKGFNNGVAPFYLEKSPKPKGNCPQCGYNKQFRYYQDRVGNRLEDYGRCERVNSCGYHVRPTGSAVPKTDGIHTASLTPVILYPDGVVLKQINDALSSPISPFHTYCTTLGIPLDHLLNWGVGGEKGRTVFVFSDAQGRVTNAKWITYMPTGRRVKEKNSNSLKQPGSPADQLTQPKRYRMCLYGEHLLRKDPAIPVMLVESEKTAVIASFSYPQFDWIAVGSANGLTDDKIGALYGRKLFWLADADGALPITSASGKAKMSEGGRNNSSIRKLAAYKQNFSVIDLFPDRTDGFDLADAIEQGIQPDSDTLLSSQMTEATTQGGEISPAKNSLNGSFHEPKVWYDEEEYLILIYGQRVWNVVARGFLLYIKYMTEDEYENQMWVLEIRLATGESIFIEVPHDDFSSASRLKRTILSKRFSLQITDTDLGKLQEYLFRETEFKTATKITRFGYHVESGVFFFANAAVYEGQQLTPDRFNVVEVGKNLASDQPKYILSMPTLPKRGRHPFTLTNNTLTFTAWWTLYQQAHLYENAFIPACFYVMALFRDLSITHKNFSPILYLKGSAGTGKSSIVRNLTCLFGYKAKDINLKSKNTAAALVKLMSQSSNTVVWFDEFFNNFEHEGLLQAAYDNAGYHLSAGIGTADTAEIDIKSSLALTSNYVPDNEIFFSRCLFVPITSNTKTANQHSAYKYLTTLEEAGLGCITVELLQYRNLVQQQYATAYNDLYSGLSAKLPQDTPERLKQNMTQAMTAAYLLNKAGKITMTEFTETDDILDEFVRLGHLFIQRQRHLQAEKSPLSEYFAILQQLYNENRIIALVHFNIKQDVFEFRFSELYTLFKEKYRKVHYKEAPGKDSILDEICQLGEYPDSTKALKSIAFQLADEQGLLIGKKQPREGCKLPYSLIKQLFDVDF